MLELGMRTGAATTAVLRNDPEQARVALKSLREQMTRVGAMVPTWKPYFGTGVLDELDRAVSAKADLATRRKLVGKLESSCTSCHAKYMFQVQAQYRWGSFADAVVSAGSGTLTFHEVMLDLASDLGAVRADVQAGQFTEATAVYKRLMERFGMMEQLCANCHDQPRQPLQDRRAAPARREDRRRVHAALQGRERDELPPLPPGAHAGRIRAKERPGGEEVAHGWRARSSAPSWRPIRPPVTWEPRSPRWPARRSTTSR
jgi:cytochrome c556